jgi:hypothetical protein
LISTTRFDARKNCRNPKSSLIKSKSQIQSKAMRSTKRFRSWFWYLCLWVLQRMTGESMQARLFSHDKKITSNKTGVSQPWCKESRLILKVLYQRWESFSPFRWLNVQSRRNITFLFLSMNLVVGLEYPT